MKDEKNEIGEASITLSKTSGSGKIWIAMRCARIGYGGHGRVEEDSVVGVSETEYGILKLVREILDEKSRWLHVVKKTSDGLRWIVEPNNGEGLERSKWRILVFCTDMDAKIELNMLSPGSLKLM